MIAFQLRNQHFISFTATLIIAALIIVLNLTHPPLNILSWDVFGYYLILPQIFIHHDILILDPAPLMEAVEKYKSTTTLYQVIPANDGAMVMRYSLGMAVMYLPFFLIGHLIAIVGGFPVDGFSAPYQNAILLAGISYAIMGFFFLRSVLRRFIPDLVVAFTLLIIYLGTNLLFHSSLYGSNAMSHNYLFGLYGLILWLTERWHRNRRMSTLYMLAVVCGTAILARPTELVILFIPLLLGVTSWKVFVGKFLDLLKSGVILRFTIILAFFGGLQLIYWKATTGNFINLTYAGNPGEGLDLLRPHLAGSLISFRKGWFIYTPIVLLGFFGLIPLFRRQKILFFPIAIYLALNIFLVSSWSNWWYADSFSQRAYIPSLAILSIPMAYGLAWMGGNLKRLLPGIVILILFLILNLFQSWQYIEGILHPSRMTAEYYFTVFGETSIPGRSDTLLLVDRNFNTRNSFRESERYTMVLDTTIISEDPTFLHADERFSDLFKLPFNKITEKDHLWIVLDIAAIPSDSTDVHNIHLVSHMNRKGRHYAYQGVPAKLDDLDSNGIAKMTLNYLTPELRAKKDRVKAYVFYGGNDTCIVTKFRARAYERIWK